jgi:hypothetical protein
VRIACRRRDPLATLIIAAALAHRWGAKPVAGGKVLIPTDVVSGDRTRPEGPPPEERLGGSVGPQEVGLSLRAEVAEQQRVTPLRMVELGGNPDVPDAAETAPKRADTVA